MIFKPELCDLILAGKKTQTRRPVKDNLLPVCKYQPGKTYAVQPGRGKKGVGRIRVLSARIEALRDLSQDDAIAEGFPGYFDTFPTDQFFDYWARLYRLTHNEIYSDVDMDQSVWRIEFEVVPDA